MHDYLYLYNNHAHFFHLNIDHFRAPMTYGQPFVGTVSALLNRIMHYAIFATLSEIHVSTFYQYSHSLSRIQAPPYFVIKVFSKILLRLDGEWKTFLT